MFYDVMWAVMLFKLNVESSDSLCEVVNVVAVRLESRRTTRTLHFLHAIIKNLG